MGEDSTRSEARSSATLPANLPSSAAANASLAAGASATLPPPAPSQDDQEPPLLIPSFSPNSAPSSPASTLSRLGFKMPPTSPGGSPGSPGQVSAITVVALLDKLVAMMEQVQENQRRAEKRQAELEAIVRGVQGDVTRLAKSHSGTSNSVNKLLERSRKTGANVKEVRERLDRQGTQVKRLEANHAHLLKRNHFKVLIFQEDNEIPSTLLMKDSTSTAASLREVQEDMSIHAPSADANHSHEEGLHTISLTSDEDDEEAMATAAGGMQLSSPRGEAGGDLHLDEDDEDDGLPSLECERLERSRAEKLKRSSLKKVDSLKKAFSRQSIEKKINKIVPPERREKIKKSFTPNHPKSPTTKNTSFRVSPMTFNVKKVRDGQETAGAAAGTPEAHVEVPSLGGPGGELTLTEVHSPDEKEPSTSATGSVDGELSAINGGEVDANGVVTAATLAEEEPMPDHDDDDDDDENEEEEESASPLTSPAATAAKPAITAVPVEQAS